MFGCGAKRGKEQRQWTAMLMDESRITTEQKASSVVSGRAGYNQSPGTVSRPSEKHKEKGRLGPGQSWEGRGFALCSWGNSLLIPRQWQCPKGSETATHGRRQLARGRERRVRRKTPGPLGARGRPSPGGKAPRPAVAKAGVRAHVCVHVCVCVHACSPAWHLGQPRPARKQGPNPTILSPASVPTVLCSASGLIAQPPSSR